MKKRLTDTELVEMLYAGGTLMEDAARYLLQQKKLKRQIIQFITSRGGNTQVAEDIYIDGLTQLIFNIRKNKFQHKSTLSTYLLSICKYRWYDYFQQRQKQEERDRDIPLPTNDLALSPEEVYLKQETGDQLNAHLNQLGENGKKVLALWALGYSLKEIAARTKYKDENVVAKTKSKYLKTLKTLVLANPYWDKK